MAIGCRVGVSTYPDCATTADELLKCADIAMYRSKQDRNYSVHFYNRVVHSDVQYKMAIEQGFENALSSGHSLMYYQPQICSDTGSIVGIEALARWNSPQMGFIPPDVFIRILEENGKIKTFGRWLVGEILNDYSIFHTLCCDLTLSFNLSPIQLEDTSIVKFLEEILNKYSVKAEAIEIELTETCLDISERAKAILFQVSELGVKIALDDFGTGYSSLSHLKDFPIDVIKIDKEFVMSVVDDVGYDAQFLKALTLFAHSLGYSVVAEGVETQIQADFCSNLKVRRQQGYLYSKAISADQLKKLLSDQNTQKYYPGVMQKLR